MPKATATLSDSFLPRMGMATITSACAKISGGSPSTSAPKIKTILLFLKARFRNLAFTGNN